MARSHSLPITTSRAADWLPPHAYFVVSAVFHYLGPAFAVLLFAHLDVLGVAWLRIASAAVFFAAWRRPWRFFRRLAARDRWIIVGLGAVLAVMNSTFYLAIARLPLGTVGAIEFLGPIALVASGTRTWRNLLALVLAVAGVLLLADVRVAGQPLGFALAFANCALFALYVVVAHRIAQRGAGIDGLGTAMVIALVVVMPVGLAGALPAFTRPLLLGAGICVGICSSIVPYLTDQLAMARLARPTYALLLSLLPATATVIGILVLRQLPHPLEVTGIAAVVAGVALHRER